MEIFLNQNSHRNNLKLCDKYMKSAMQERKEQTLSQYSKLWCLSYIPHKQLDKLGKMIFLDHQEHVIIQLNTIKWPLGMPSTTNQSLRQVVALCHVEGSEFWVLCAERRCESRSGLLEQKDFSRGRSAGEEIEVKPAKHSTRWKIPYANAWKCHSKRYSYG